MSESGEPSPETLPEPELQLTPEQVLIAAIESQVQNVTSKLGDGLIRSIKADFTRSKLVVLLSNEWYNLTSDRQNQLANEMLVEARGLDFQTLEITDSERYLLARSPVVGSGMIILRRSLSPNT
ncbi:hypothetical protein [[Phormidium] sp. ETS-05]|uniref:hypothetical protein n=1 Tax=[Phormidium] sp. ETS-05 TaxID=222819 RepID=UPI0018EEE491|nr:hypothetical protein [[Phormidium] sp. ETS-05]